MPEEWLHMITDPFFRFWDRVIMILPNVVAGLLLLFVGLILARMLRGVIERILHAAKVDDTLEIIGMNEVLSRVGFGRSPSYALGFLAYWLVVLAFLVSASNAVQLTIVSELLERFTLFMPKIISAVLVLAGGVVLGHFLAQIVTNAANSNHIGGAMTLGKITQITTVLFTGIIALEQIGINVDILTNSIQVVLGSIGLTLALAFGLGGKEVAQELIRDLLKRNGK